MEVGWRLGGDWVEIGWRLGGGWVEVGWRLGGDWVEIEFRGEGRKVWEWRPNSGTVFHLSLHFLNSSFEIFQYGWRLAIDLKKFFETQRG